MTERNPVIEEAEHAFREALVHRIHNRCANHRLEKIGIDDHAENGPSLEDSAAFHRDWRRPRQDGIANRIRERRITPGHDFGDIERVATGAGVQRGRVDPRAFSHGGDHLQ